MKLILALLIALSPVSQPLSSAAASPRGAHDEQQAITLTVHVLPTSNAADTPPPETYPKTIQVNDAGAFSDRIAAYGLANSVWIAPKGWTGSATVGADASTLVTLYPVNGSAKSGPRFRYEYSGGCSGCALDEAAPYFPNAMKAWKNLFGLDGETIPALPRGTKLTPVSSTLVMYTLSTADNLLGKGATCFVPHEDSFEKAEFILPQADARLLKWLMQTVVRRYEDDNWVSGGQALRAVFGERAPGLGAATTSPTKS